MLLSTLFEIKGKEFETLGLVKGATTQTKNIGRDFAASLKTLVGGELKGFTELLNEARNIASNRMIEEAQQMGADAIIGIHFSSSAIMQGASEILAYGTAIKYK